MELTKKLLQLTHLADSIRYYAGNTDKLDDEYTRNEPNDDKVIEYSNRVENWPAESAPKYLEGMIRRYEEGELLPDTFCGIIEVDPKGSVSKIQRPVPVESGRSHALCANCCRIGKPSSAVS